MPIIKAYNARPIVGSSAYVRTLKKAKKQRTVLEMLERRYSKKKLLSTLLGFSVKKLMLTGTSSQDIKQLRDTMRRILAEGLI